jgi:SAM-dependent methyltransferase
VTRGRVDREQVIGEFTHQADAFNASPAMQAADTLGRLLELLPASPGERWLDAACGPGIVARALAPRVAEVEGVDLTPAMVDLASREAAAGGIGNIRFALGDVTALPYADGAFDGAVTRFSLHHVPLPGRVVAELARVVRPGGVVAVADHVTSDVAVTAAWHEEIERLRDPSHWACLTPARIAGLGRRAGLAIVREERWDFTIDFEEWLGRGSGGEASRALIEQALRDAPPGGLPFRVAAGDGWRTLGLTLAVFVWRRPG